MPVVRAAVATLPRQSHAPVLGRRAECEILHRVVADVTGGRSRVLLLRGAAGVGKRALLACLAGRVRNWRIISALGVESEMELADEALRRISAKTRAAGTDWAMGIEARSRALLADGDAAENAFRVAVERLGRSSVRHTGRA
jgi:predicted ABC-type transport system involved in lysophospholipase L1 biosynthesis ATPase subunit